MTNQNHHQSQVDRRRITFIGQFDLTTDRACPMQKATIKSVQYVVNLFADALQLLPYLNHVLCFHWLWLAIYCNTQAQMAFTISQNLYSAPSRSLVRGAPYHSQPQENSLEQLVECQEKRTLRKRRII